MTLYDPERDPVRIAGRWLRWGLVWVGLPLLAGVLVGMMAGPRCRSHAHAANRAIPLTALHQARGARVKGQVAHNRQRSPGTGHPCW